MFENRVFTKTAVGGGVDGSNRGKSGKDFKSHSP